MAKMVECFRAELSWMAQITPTCWLYIYCSKDESLPAYRVRRCVSVGEVNPRDEDFLKDP